jgi:hypothetical protein
MSAPSPPKKRPAPRKPRTIHKPAGPLADGQAALIQSAAEGAVSKNGERVLADGEIAFKGEVYKISDSVGLWPMIQFARAAEAGLNLGDFRALAALHSLLESCIAKDDWGRFQENMIATREADLEALLDVATSVIAKLAARPTKQPSASSNGEQEASPGSTDGSSSTPEEE